MSDFLGVDDLSTDALSRVFVDTIQTKAMFRGLDDLFANPRTASNGRGIAVLGPPRCGKTLLVKEYLTRCRNSDVQDRPDEQVTRRPLKYLYVRLQPNTRLANIASQTLVALDHPAPFAGKHDTNQIRAVINMIKEGSYETVVFDEVHHLTSSETRNVRDNGSHWLTHVLDETRCPMILIGYSRFARILQENGFLSGRLIPATPLVPYTSSDPDSFGMFQIIVKAFEDMMGMPTPSKLWTNDTAARLLAASGGRIGLLEILLTAARQEARARGHSAVVRADLSVAVERMRLNWTNLRFNPFVEESLVAAIKQHGETFRLPEDGPA